MRDKMGNNNKSALDTEEGAAIRKHQTGKMVVNRPHSQSKKGEQSQTPDPTSKPQLQS